MDQNQHFDVIVVGGGHAGTEAACAAARTGARTLLLTHNIETIGQMSCNPAIGGIGKGHLVREIDALGGVMARAADCAGIQFRTLNRRKGPAVRATRCQADRSLYRAAVRRMVENQTNLCLFQQSVEDLIVEQGRVVGVTTGLGLTLRAGAVVLTVGTFLAGKIHVGRAQHAGGRAGDGPSVGLAARLRASGLRVGRLKTGTPPRLDGGSVDYRRLQVQRGDQPRPVFSFLGQRDDHPPQANCHITHTNEHTHDIIRAGLKDSPIYSGSIEGAGPRYCPSVEDKVVRFAERAAHQIFIEPEGLGTREIYPNGISTSLPFSVQTALVRSIAGFENAHITRPGYAIEYDFFDPRDLHYSLEARTLPGLFLAGQINGTTGYEEAAAQGLLAGINAARSVAARPAWWPMRDQAYTGVLVDDLITRGATEPYRMFTSRAEYRLLLREDNADLRLTPIGRELGLVDDERWQRLCAKRAAIDAEQARLDSIWLRPGDADAAALQASTGTVLARERSASDLLQRPGVDYAALRALSAVAPGVDDPQVAEQISIQAKYAGYIQRARAEIARNRRLEETHLPPDLAYGDVRGLSNEVREKLAEQRPASVGQAARIPGVTPAAISLLLVHLKKNGYRLQQTA